jgi:hypothetical protein
MQDNALEDINLKPKKRADRLSRSISARRRRKVLKQVRETRLLNAYAKLKRARRNK